MSGPLSFTRYWYLATQYTKHADGLANAEREAAMAAAKLLAGGVCVFSPITHCCSIARWGNLDPLDGKFWLAVDVPLMIPARGLIVVDTLGWSLSEGIAKEISYFQSFGKPIVFWTIDKPIPEVLLNGK
jgi:hypothetical protein